jgi:bacteriocin-like protein
MSEENKERNQAEPTIEEGKQELNEQDLQQVAGGASPLQSACAKGTHIAKATITL